MSTSGKTEAALAFAVLLALCGCAVGPNFKTPAPPRVDRWDFGGAPLHLDADGAPQTIELAAATDARWWTLFRSPSLDALVARGVSDSPTLESAREALKAAHYDAKAGAGVFLPWAGAGASATHYRSVPERFGFTAPAYDYDLYALGGNIGYAIDLFGGARRQHESLKAALESRRYAMGSAYLLLTGSIAQAAIARAGYAEETATLEDLVKLETGRRATAAAQAKAGHLSEADVLDADQRLAAAKEALNETFDRQGGAEGLIRTLVGLEPGEPLPPVPALDDLAIPADAPASLPSQLVRQRPDILQAEADLHRASADVGVATAALFPSISITGEYGGAAFALARLGGTNNTFWSLGPTLDVPVLSDGSRWFGRKAAQAAYRQALADYRSVVLSALQQTSGAIGTLYTDAERSANARAAYDAAVGKAEVAAAKRKAGLISGDEEVAARIDLDQARLQLIAAKTTRLQDVVALYLACGGGWAASKVAD